MVRLIIFECRKHFFKKSIPIVLLLFCIINVMKISSVYNEKSLLSRRFSESWAGLFWQQYDKFGGEMTLDKINSLMEIYEPLEKQTADLTASTALDNPNTFTGNTYSDFYFFRDCYVRPMEYSYLYERNAKSIVTAAKNNISFYRLRGNSYEADKNAAIARLYKGRIITDFAYTEMYKYLLQYDFSTILVSLVCLYGLINVFVLEKETDMEAILLTAKSGGRQTVLAKIFASALFVMAVCSLFWLVDFAAFAVFFGGVKGSDSPIFALQNFEYASVNMNLFQYTLLSAAIKTVGMLTLGMGFLAVSCLFKNALIPFIINLTGTAGLLFTSELVMGSGYIFRKIINPFILIANYELFRKTEFLNFFGTPLPSYLPALLFTIVLGVILIVTILYLPKRNSIFRRKHHENNSARS